MSKEQKKQQTPKHTRDKEEWKQSAPVGIEDSLVKDYTKKSKELKEMEKLLNLSNNGDWATWDSLPLTESDRIHIIKSYIANPEEWVTTAPTPPAVEI